MKTLILVLLLVALVLAAFGWTVASMPGASYAGPLPAITEEEEELARELALDVETIGRDIGPRGTHAPEKLAEAEDYLENRLRRMGLSVETVPHEARGRTSNTLVAQVTGARAPGEVILVGAHYDSAARRPGANANASGCAVLLAIASRVAAAPCDRTVRFVLFTDGAPPLAGREDSGAAAYASRAKQAQDKILLMIALDSLGTYRDDPGSQQVPFPLGPLYPDRGDFVAFVGSLTQRESVSRAVGIFRQASRFPSQGVALPGWLPGVGESDDAAFRAAGFRAIRITDPGPLRSSSWGGMSDTSDRIDVARMARVTTCLARLVTGLAVKSTSLD